MKFKLSMYIASFILFAAVPTALASTTWYVDGVSGSDNNDCKTPTTACKTIGHAISLAGSRDTISVAAATYRENLTIAVSLNMLGASAATTIIDGGSHGSVVTIPSRGARVTLSNLTIRNGLSSTAGAGIYNSATLTIKDSNVSGNSVAKVCTTPCSLSGGGIFNASAGVLTISGSTISGNSVAATVTVCGIIGCFASGGGIGNDGTLAISNSTISGNVVAISTNIGGGHGGGISGGTIVMSNTTLSGNSAASLGGGGGIYVGTSATLKNSIVTKNVDGANRASNCSGSVTSKGYNLSSDGSCDFSGPGDLNNTDAMLGPLQNNGGATQTQALLSGSPAIDAGNPSGCTDGQGRLLTTDQRGKPRPDKEDSGSCDMGAYERQQD
jgi:hypothetical protein